VTCECAVGLVCFVSYFSHHIFRATRLRQWSGTAALPLPIGLCKEVDTGNGRVAYSELYGLNLCTTSLTLHNSTFCPHSVFMCFVWI
jgi:hypothetical protein